MRPTQFPELNAILEELTERAEQVLGENFVGAYLQGSFAVGDADMASDCDFLIPVSGPITAKQEAGLRAMHDELPTRPQHWARHLEGSYPHKNELQTLGGLGKRWLYIDHGQRQMEWSTHCNTEVVRWSLRECGITLAGPDPKTLVDEVSADALRDKMREYASTFLPDLNSWTTLENAWSQRYVVSTFCRILYTLSTGRIASKKASLVWAQENLDPQWRLLIQRAIDERAEFSAKPARPGDAEATLAFIDYAEALATR